MGNIPDTRAAATQKVVITNHHNAAIQRDAGGKGVLDMLFTVPTTLTARLDRLLDGFVVVHPSVVGLEMGSEYRFAVTVMGVVVGVTPDVKFAPETYRRVIVDSSISAKEILVSRDDVLRPENGRPVYVCFTRTPKLTAHELHVVVERDEDADDDKAVKVDTVFVNTDDVGKALLQYMNSLHATTTTLAFGMLFHYKMQGRGLRIRVTSVRGATKEDSAVAFYDPSGILFVKVTVGSSSESSSDSPKLVLDASEEDSQRIHMEHLHQKLTCEALEIGGVTALDLKKLRRAVMSRYVHPEYAKKHKINSVKGICFSGPPGTGKTYLARKLAEASGMVLTMKNGTEFGSKWYGETEANIRKLFDPAREDMKTAKPGSIPRQHLIFLDEIDAIASSRGGSGSSDVGNRVIAELLVNLDGVNSPTNVLVIVATNRYDMLDPAFVRSGRISMHVEFRRPTYPERIDILRIHGRGTLCKLFGDEYIAELCKRMPSTVVGADIKRFVDETSEVALQRVMDDVHVKKMKTETETETETKIDAEAGAGSGSGSGSDDTTMSRPWLHGGGDLAILREDVEHAFACVFAK